MKKLIILLAVILMGCEANNIKQFTVTVEVKKWTTYEVEFPNLLQTETNPLIISCFNAGWSYDTTVTTTSESPFIVRAKHYNENDMITVKIYEGKRLLLADSAEGKYNEIWLTYEWD